MSASRFTTSTLTVVCSVLMAFAFGARPALAQSCNPAPGVITDTAFQTLLTNCAGKTITFAAGTYRFTPNGYETGFNVPAETTLQGNGSTGSNATIFQIASTGAYQALLWAHNASNIAIKGIDFEDIDALNGNKSYSSGCAEDLNYGSAIYLISDSASSSVQNVTISSNLFHDFNGFRWILLEAYDLSGGIGTQNEIAISSNTFVSDALLNGGCAATQGQTVYMVTMQGSENYPTSGLIQNVSVAANQFSAGYVEGAIAIYSNVADVSVQYNTITGAGNKLPPVIPPGGPNKEPEPFRYAVLVYSDAYIAKENGSPGNGLPPNTIWIIGNTITNPESCGIYVVSSTNIGIQSNTISGQTDIYDETLPKGALVMNGSTTLSSYPLQGNQLSGNYVGLAIVLGSLGGYVATGTNTISVPANNFGAKLTLGGGSDTLNLQGLTVTATAGTNATSVVGYGNPATQGFLGVAQNGWTVTGGGNPALIWFSSPAGSEYTSFSQVPKVTFGNSNDPITADGVHQGAFWHP
jgi:hypothetical protein